MSLMNQLFPPRPIFTEAKLPDQAGKVFIVTGGAAGVGIEVAKALYGKNGTVYIATRSSEKMERAVEHIRKTRPDSKGRLQPLVVDFADLTSIKPAVDKFLAKERRLDVLFNNAAVMTPPAGSKTAQGLDLEMGTNTVGAFLLTRLLEHVLCATAQMSPHGSVRTVWVSSFIGLGTSPGGVAWDETSKQPAILAKDARMNYMQSKVANIFLAHEYAKRLGDKGVLSTSLHPGLMKTELQRHSPALRGFVMGVIFKGPEYGACTELFAGLSQDITAERNGSFIIPWGRFGPIPDEVATGMKTEHEGGTGLSQRLWEWCEAVTAPYSQQRVSTE
ncbi:short-chain dehydrogenase [Xylariales sp. AK1849]|nr:short-chain dehydrogenase [Xylariales sp. AK1849]